MKLKNKILSLAAALAMLTSSGNLIAAEYCIDNGGCGYDDSCRTSSLAPAIALGTIVVVAIVAVAVQNTSGHSHCHFNMKLKRYCRV